VRARVAALLAVPLLLAVGCSDEPAEPNDPAGPSPTNAAPEPAVDESFEPEGCELPAPELDQDTVAEAVYAMPVEPLEGVTMESAVATPGGDSVELTVVRETGDCTGTATVTGPADQEYDVLGMTLDVGAPVPSEGDESRAALPVRVVAAR
jgi:hypothetical protein